MNYHVAVGIAVFILRIKHTVRHVHVVIDDFILAYPVECRHFGHAPFCGDKCFTYYYSIVRRDFQPLRRKNGNNSLLTYFETFIVADSFVGVLSYLVEYQKGISRKRFFHKTYTQSYLKLFCPIDI